MLNKELTNSRNHTVTRRTVNRVKTTGANRLPYTGWLSPHVFQSCSFHYITIDGEDNIPTDVYPRRTYIDYFTWNLLGLRHSSALIQFPLCRMGRSNGHWHFAIHSKFIHGSILSHVSVHVPQSVHSWSLEHLSTKRNTIPTFNTTTTSFSTYTYANN